MRNISEILSLDNPDTLTDKEGLDAVAQLVDDALDQSDSELIDKALAWCQQLDARPLHPKQRALLDYFRANAWANRQQLIQSDRTAVWAWDLEASQQQIFLLRRAFNNEAFEELHLIRRSQIFTNLANQLNTVGRFIEALAMWGEALRQLPTFWMARGNRGQGLMYYAGALYDSGQRRIFALIAQKELTQAIHDLDQNPELGDPSLRPRFVDAAADIARHFDLPKIAADYHPDGFALGSSEDERAYRRWCLLEVLFLNPLNDLGPHSIAAQDVLTLPNFVTTLSEPPVLVGFFN